MQPCIVCFRGSTRGLLCYGFSGTGPYGFSPSLSLLFIFFICLFNLYFITLAPPKPRLRASESRSQPFFSFFSTFFRETSRLLSLVKGEIRKYRQTDVLSGNGRQRCKLTALIAEVIRAFATAQAGRCY